MSCVTSPGSTERVYNTRTHGSHLADTSDRLLAGHHISHIAFNDFHSCWQQRCSNLGLLPALGVTAAHQGLDLWENKSRHAEAGHGIPVS
jgi:hypothetical protein